MLRNKDVLGLKDLTADEMAGILDTAAALKSLVISRNKRSPHLQGKSVVTMFYESSTRTRLSFELAAKYMSGVAANVTGSGSSVEKGETLADTCRTIDAMGTDVLILRHPMSGAAHLAARNVGASVINAGDGMNEHPTQGLLDMFTIRERKGRIEGLKVCITGDAFHSRVARSNIWGLTRMGAEVIVSAPRTMVPVGIGEMGARVVDDLDLALKGADVVMGLRIQLERQKKGMFPSIAEYSRFYGVDERRMRLAKGDAIVLHPGPVNRGVELTSAVVDCDRSYIDEQVTNGVAVRMALLYLLTRRSANEVTA